MRFGIMAMQIDQLVPAGIPAEQVFSNLMGFDQATLVRGLAEDGFNPVELGGDLGIFLPQAFSDEAIDHLFALKSEYGLGYTVHLPLWSVEPSTPQQHVRKGSVQALVDSIRATNRLEPESYVIHAFGALASEFYQMKISETAKMLILRQFQSSARESLKMILEETGINSRKLAIETVEFPFDLTLEIAEDLDTSMCLDTGHVLVGFAGPIDLFDALEQCLPRLGEIHLHDGPWQGPERKLGYGKDHQPLGKGDLDVARFLDRLHAADWNGPIIFELKTHEALESLDVIRRIRPQYLP